ncbi:hypothetical protein [Paractinoplanes toevensis]|uniref:Uncharacterized protein n=1 Tax=Paractinoplanes toevensis TaxID=571911 RepID=A0A919TDR6_9ACTN|nr:hypothetical protein [Actinoplanes toevensis]GIM92309.1 hypothetical protein Ato02nite_041020 [Actinoplanes toevensis]
MSRTRTWWPIGLSLVAAVALLYAVVLPGGYLTWLRVAMVLWAVAAVGWVVSLAGRSWMLRSVLPVVSVVTMVVACSGMVGRVLFPLHRSGLERLATAPLGGSYGLYRFSAVWSHDGCVAYVTEDSGMSYFSGLLRCTPGVRPSPRLGDTAGDAVFDPLGDDWYAFSVPRSGSQIWGFNPFTVRATTQV